MFSRRVPLLVPVSFLLIITTACAGFSSGHTSTSAGDGLKIQHVIIIFQENRTPDNLFHGLAGADIADSGINSQGQNIPLTPVSFKTTYDLDHSHLAFLSMYDGGKMDGADKVVCYPTPNCTVKNPQFQYVNRSESAPYFQLAEHYTFGDRMFQTNQGPSFPAHQFIISGTSAPTANSNLFAAENVWNQNGPPGGNSFDHSGCTAPSNDFVMLIDPAGYESSSHAPCFDHPTLPDLLDSARMDWRYYAIAGGWNSYWNGPAAIQHIRQGADWSKVIPQQTQVLMDIANGTLPAVSWVMPSGQASDHAGATDGSGPSWVSSIVNAVGDSQYWWNTAIFVTWDDWGGWYDHVAPPIYNSYEYGFRVPLLVISPYAKRGYVSHVTHDFGSILRFVEDNWNLPTLGYADSRADNLGDCFDLGQNPQPFERIYAPLDARHFIEDTSAPLDPDDD